MRPGIEPWSLGLLANTLPTRLMSRFITYQDDSKMIRLVETQLKGFEWHGDYFVEFLRFIHFFYFCLGKYIS